MRRLSERYGGMARVTARAGGGAVFTVVLPEALAPERLARDDAPFPALPSPGHHPRKTALHAGLPLRQLTTAGESP